MGDLKPQRHDVISIVFVVFVSFFLVLAWWAVDMEEEKWGREKTASAADIVSLRLVDYFNDRFHAVESLLKEWRDGSGVSKERYVEASRAVQNMLPGFQALNWMDPNKVIRWVVPEGGNRSAIGADLGKHPLAGPIIVLADKDSRFHATPPLDLIQGGRGFAVYRRINTEGKTAGYLNSVFRIDKVVNRILGPALAGTYGFSLRDGNRPIYVTGDVDDGPLVLERSFLIADRQWTLRMKPVSGVAVGNEIFLGVGLVLAVISGWFLRLFLLRNHNLLARKLELERNLAEQEIIASIIRISQVPIRFDEMLEMALDIILTKGKYGIQPKGCIFLTDKESGDLVMTAQRGLTDILLETCKRVKPGRCLCGRAAERGEIIHAGAIDQRHENTYDGIQPHGHYCAPIQSDGEILGVLNLYVPEGHQRNEVEDKFVSMIASTLAGIIRRKQIEDQLRQSEERFSKVFHASPVLMAVAGIDDGLLYDVNEMWLTTLGYSKNEVIGKTVVDAGIWQDFQQRVSFIKAILKDKSVRDFEGSFKTKSGEVRDFVLNGETIEVNNQRRLLVVSHDITERKGIEKRKEHMASHDPLTGLPNRVMLMDRLDQAMAMSRRNKTKVAVLFLDLDNFKPINDTMGHKFGDQVLKQIADRLSLCMRETDTVARLGGDEFVVVLNDVKDKRTVTNMAKKISRVLSEPIPLGSKETSIGASIGIALYPQHARVSEALISLADDAMYQVKKKGKNDFFFATAEK